MTFRRQLLVVTLTLGGGILCFQPVMRARMESRISEILGARVAIGASKISLTDGTVAFQDVVVHHSNSHQGTDGYESLRQTKIEQAALKFNWNSLLFRNLKVDSFVASNVRWQIGPPNPKIIPPAAEGSGHISLVPQDGSADSAVNVEPIVSPINLRIVQEATKQSRVHLDVSSRIKKVMEQLTEAMPTDGTFNVLRQTFVVDDTKKELAIIKQSIAEDRIARKESDKAFVSLKLSAEKSLITSLTPIPELESSKINQASIQLAKLAVAREWNSHRAIVQAVLGSFRVAQSQVNSGGDQDGDTLRDSRAEFLSRLPVGVTSFAAGKVKGVVQFPDVATDTLGATSSFEFQFRNLSSRDNSKRERPAISLTMSHDLPQNAPPWLACSAQQVRLPQSDALQLRIILERVRPGQSKSTTAIQHANQGWAATISLPIKSCFELASAEPLWNANSHKNETSEVVGKLVGTTPPHDSEQNKLLIDVDSASVNALEAILAPAFRSVAERKQSQASIRGTELLNSELQKIGLRWDQLGDEHSRLHAGWEISLKELNDQLYRLETAINRTSRTSNTFTR